MDILKIGHGKIFQNEIQENSAPLRSPDSGTSEEEQIKVDIGLPGTGHTVYDQNGKVTGPDESPENKQAAGPKDSSGQTLSEAEQRELQMLKQTDRTVRAHEMAHAAAGGNLVRGGPNFEYRKGPDGNNYAVGGEVNIDTSKEKTPEQTLIKMQRVQAAALAPADPSGQDRAVAGQAAQTAQQARVEISQKVVSGGKASTEGSATKTDKTEQEQPQKMYAGTAASSKTRKPFHIIV